jgi:hypothetical protein
VRSSGQAIKNTGKEFIQVGHQDGNMGVQTVLGQNHFLCSFRTARLDGTSDEALGFHGVRTGLQTGFQTRLSGKEQYCNSQIPSGRL